jgi:replicative DNA helicase
MWGKDDVDPADYEAYLQGLQQMENKFVVSTPLDFDKKITVTKIKNWIKQYKLDVVAIDGITYMTDERFKRGDSKTTSLTNISEDLMGLSMEIGVPILVVVQANRGGVVEKGTSDTPELESIRDSDGIAHNASKILSIHQKEHGTLVMTIKKQRMGAVGGSLTYHWDINTGNFQFIPNYDDAEAPSITDKKVAEVRKKFNDSTDVF